VIEYSQSFWISIVVMWGLCIRVTNDTVSRVVGLPRSDKICFECHVTYNQGCIELLIEHEKVSNGRKGVKRFSL